MGLTRQQIANFYRPLGPKQIVVGLNAAPGQTPSITNIDLSLPIEGLRFVYRGRVTVATANYTSVKPEGILNLLKNFKILGTNARAGGNVTLFDIDLATFFGIKSMFAVRPDQFQINGTSVPVPGTPYVGTNPWTGAVGSFDFQIVVDVPFFPFNSNVIQRPGFLVRAQEWGSSLQAAFTFGAVPDNAENPLGVSAATSVTTFTGFGVGTGTPTLDVYALPIIMGQDLRNQVLPGFCTRVQQPATGILTGVSNNLTLLQLQQQSTSRVFVKSGTSTLQPAFATLTDTNITALGITLGGNRYVRNLLDIFAHKEDQTRQYGREAIQGYTMFDFMQSGNSRSAYPGDKIGNGATFNLVANCLGVANAYSIVIQEQLLYQPEGQLYAG